MSKDYAALLAEKALENGAIRLSPDNPFTWASGYRMPIYNDNRQFLADWKSRAMIADAFADMLQAEGYDPANIAGTSTAGIPHATTLADRLHKSLSYVRSSSKDHGLHQRIEGLDASGSYHHAKVLLVEDLVSTGGSSVEAVRSIVRRRIAHIVSRFSRMDSHRVWMRSMLSIRHARYERFSIMTHCCFMRKGRDI